MSLHSTLLLYCPWHNCSLFLVPCSVTWHFDDVRLHVEQCGLGCMSSNVLPQLILAPLSHYLLLLCPRCGSCFTIYRDVAWLLL